MKRIIILAGAITMMIGASAFAQNMENTGVNKNSKTYAVHSNHSMGRGKHHSRHCCENGSRFQNKEMEANRIAIMEKKVELRKEMLKDTPDWNKVEKINKDIATKRAENHTMMMKERMNTNS